MNNTDYVNRLSVRWHILALVSITLIFSLLCIGTAAGKILDWMSSEQEDEMARQEKILTVTASTNLEEPEIKEKTDSKLKKLVLRADRFIDHLDRLWDRSIYRKAELSRIDAVFTYLTTGEIASSQVICGNNGWMFYKSPNDGNSMADYEGTNRYTEKELNNMLEITLATQREAEERGIHFEILVPPNKENVYPEYMPKQYNHAPVSSTDILVECLRDGGVRICSPKTELIDYSNRAQIYYSFDSHWNQLGGYIGVRTALKEWGIDYPDLSERRIDTSLLKDCYHDSAVDDLARMAGLLSFFDNEKEYIEEGTLLPDWVKYGEEQNNGNLSVFLNKEAEIDNTVLLIGDSFRTALIPALREIFSRVYVIHRSSFRGEMLNTIQPDYLLMEYVERYSSEIGGIDFLFQ